MRSKSRTCNDAEFRHQCRFSFCTFLPFLQFKMNSDVFFSIDGFMVCLSRFFFYFGKWQSWGEFVYNFLCLCKQTNKYPQIIESLRIQWRIYLCLFQRIQDRIGQDRIGQDRIGQDRIGQVRIGQDRIGQDRIGQDRIGQDRIGQDRIG